MRGEFMEIFDLISGECVPNEKGVIRLKDNSGWTLGQSMIKRDRLFRQIEHGGSEDIPNDYRHARNIAVSLNRTAKATLWDKSA